MKMVSTVGQDVLMAYADGRLPEGERGAVEAYLAANPDAAAEVALWQRQNEAVSALFPAPAETNPARLRPQEIARRANGERSTWARLAATAMLLLTVGGVAGWLAHGALEPGLSANDRLVARATVAHMLYTREKRHAVEVAAADETHLLNWLSNRLGTPVMAPDLSARGFALVGGRLLPPDPEAGAGPAAQLMYENAASERLTVYVTPALPNARTSNEANQHDGLEAFHFADKTITCTVVGNMPAAQMEPIARQIYQEVSRAVDPPVRQG